MRTALLRFISELRAAGLRISVAESMDAMQAVGVVGVERELLREALAASLVKEEDDRFTFDEIFSRFFAGPRGQRKGKPQTNPGEGERQQSKNQGTSGQTQEQLPEKPQPHQSTASRASEQQSDNSLDHIPLPLEVQSSQRGQEEQKEQKSNPPSHLLAPKKKALLEKPFHLFDGRDVEEAKELVEALARQLRGRLSRRYKPRKHGRLDFRRTLRASIGHGGVPIDLRLRDRRPGKPDLVVFCDLSGSVATVTDFLPVSYTHLTLPTILRV